MYKKAEGPLAANGKAWWGKDKKREGKRWTHRAEGEI